MGENRNNLDYRRNVLENLIDRPPYHYRRNTIPSDCGTIDADKNGKIVNISLSGKRLGMPPIGNNSCQTTINLYINDPHLVEKNWNSNSSIETRRKMRNEITLGKNIPNHAMMQNLLGDLRVKKFSSAPNMNTNQSSYSRIAEGIASERSITESCRLQMKPTLRRRRNTDTSDEKNKQTTVLYSSDMRCQGDFKRMDIDQILEEDEENERALRSSNDCPAHRYDHSVEKVELNEKMENNKMDQTTEYRDPLKRFKRKPFRLSSSRVDTGILYRDSKPIQMDDKVQPRRTVPCFRVRTQMVQDILNTDPEVLNTYQTKLMRNQKQMFESLRQADLEHISKNEEESCENNEVVQNRSELAEQPKKLYITPGGQLSNINVINKTLSTQILNGPNERFICSTESHGTYEEYKKKLVKNSDGSLCCKYTNYTDDDDSWSRAETRSIITSEFIKDKMKRFDKFAKMRNTVQLPVQLSENIGSSDRYNDTRKFGRRSDSALRNQGIHENSFNKGPYSVSFPKETKNAMTRLLADSSSSYPEYKTKRASRLLDRTGGPSTRNFRNEPSINSTRKFTEESNTHNSSEINNRCWPGVAERLLPRPEENIP